MSDTIVVNGNNKVDWREDITVQDVLNELGYSYTLIIVTVNDKLVPKKDYDSYKIPASAKITALHIAHGG